jgi:hypothetical protein
MTGCPVEMTGYPVEMTGCPFDMTGYPFGMKLNVLANLNALAGHKC